MTVFTQQKYPLLIYKKNPKNINQKNHQLRVLIAFLSSRKNENKPSGYDSVKSFCPKMSFTVF